MISIQLYVNPYLWSKQMGGGRKNKRKNTAKNRVNPNMKKKTAVQQAAAKRHANFKKTGVQTHGGTRKNYSKKEAEKIGKLGAVGNESSSQAFSRITGGAANPLNRAPSTAGVKVGEMKPEFASPLTGTDYSKFAAPNINYNYSERPKSDISFSDAVRGGARFNQAGRNELTGGTNVAMDNLGGYAAAIGGLGSMTIMGANAIKNLYQNTVPKFREKLEQRVNPEGDQSYNQLSDGQLISQIGQSGPATNITNVNGKFLPTQGGTGLNDKKIRYKDPAVQNFMSGVPLASAGDLSGLGIGTAGGSEAGFDRDSFNRAMEGNYDPESSGGLNIGSSAFGLDSETSSRIGRALAAGPSPRMLSEGGDLRFSDMYNADTPGATLTQGINAVKNRIPLLNRLPDMKMNSVAEEAQRQYLGYNPNLPASALARMDKRGGSGSGFVAAPTVFNQALPQQQVVPTASTTGTTQTGVDPNRLLQIQQQAYQQAYNPMTIGGFNPQFRFGGSAPSIDYSTYFNYS